MPDYYPPEVFSSSYIFDDRNKAFVDAGYDLLVYTPSPTRGIERGAKYLSHEFQLDGHLDLHRFKMMHEGKGAAIRFVRYFLCSTVQFFKGLFAKSYDAVFVGSTPPFQGAVAATLKILRGKNYVFAIQDIFPDSLVGAGFTKKGSLLWQIGYIMENYAYRNASRLVVIGQDFKRNLIEKGVPEEKIEVVYNWVDENAVVPVAKEDNPLFEEFGISREKFHVVYAGNLGNAQNIDVIIDSAKELSGDKDIEFLIFGTGGLKEQFVEKVKNYGIDNVKFFPLQPMERVSQVYGLGDVCVVSCKPGLGGAAMPSKMLSIMSAGRAVVASFDKGELTYILEQNKCGMYAPAGDVKAFADLIKQMADNREECAMMGEKARELILKKFTKAFGTSEYVRIIKSVCPTESK